LRRNQSTLAFIRRKTINVKEDEYESGKQEIYRTGTGSAYTVGRAYCLNSYSHKRTGGDKGYKVYYSYRLCQAAAEI
jgi:hypothetical protein